MHLVLLFFESLHLVIKLFKLVFIILIVDFSRLGWRLLLGFFDLFRFLWFFWLVELWLIELASFKLSLPHESFGADPLGVVVRTFSGVFEVHKTFDGDKPGPFLIAITGTKVEHILDCAYFEACGDHIFLFPYVTFVSFDFP